VQVFFARVKAEIIIYLSLGMEPSPQYPPSPLPSLPGSDSRNQKGNAPKIISPGHILGKGLQLFCRGRDGITLCHPNKMLDRFKLHIFISPANVN